MARSSEKLSERITLRLCPEELSRLKRDADTAAVDVATIARAQFLNAPVPKPTYRRRRSRQAGRRAPGLGRIETNHNQIAKVANTNNDVSHFRDAKLLKNLLEEIRDEVHAALAP